MHSDPYPTTTPPETVARGQAVLREPRGAVRWVPVIRRTYDRFLELLLELPRWGVLAVLWIAGGALLGSVALVLYSAGWVLARSVAGPI